jgi:osmotically inducible lipoprotein OsmB
MLRKMTLGLTLGGMLVALDGCGGDPGTRAVTGGLLGAGAGAGVAAVTGGRPATGALIGGGAGALGGALTSP